MSSSDVAHAITPRIKDKWLGEPRKGFGELDGCTLYWLGQFTPPHDYSRVLLCEVRMHQIVQASIHEVYTVIPRAQMQVGVWDEVQQRARYIFNKRLKAAKQPTRNWDLKRGTWMERTIGKELLLLFWGLEDPSEDWLGEAEDWEQRVHMACDRWAAFRPEERWWLTTMTMAEHGGLWVEHGWRAALRNIMQVAS